MIQLPSANGYIQFRNVVLSQFRNANEGPGARRATSPTLSNECQKTEVRGLEVRERKAFRVRLLADELFVFTSLIPEWSSPTSGFANATHLSVSSISDFDSHPTRRVPPRSSHDFT